MHNSWSGKCLGCKIIGIITTVCAVIFVLAALYAAYRVHVGTGNAFGSTNGSLSILAAVFSLGLLRKATKDCHFCKHGGDGCGCGSDCSCGGNCDCGHDHSHEAPHQH